MRGHSQEGQRWLEATLGRPEGASILRARALEGAGAVAYARSDYPTARASYEEALAILRTLNDRRGTADLLNQLGTVARKQGDYPAARGFHEQSLALYRELSGGPGTATYLNNLSPGLCECLEAFASLAVAEGVRERAVHLFAAAQRGREALHTPLPGYKQAALEADLAALRVALGADRFASTWAEGQALTPEQALAER